MGFIRRMSAVANWAEQREVLTLVLETEILDPCHEPSFSENDFELHQSFV
jgi:hypothetical protein